MGMSNFDERSQSRCHGVDAVYEWMIMAMRCGGTQNECNEQMRIEHGGVWMQQGK